MKYNLNNQNMEEIDKVLVFDVWGDYAHFRRFYTTTSPLTFPIPPRTALCGLIGAIIGLEKENNKYLNYFALDKAYIGLKIKESNPLKKVIIAENLVDTKTAKGKRRNLIKNRTQIRFEFIRNPKYRMYFYHTDNKIYDKLKEYLERHKSIYTPCFGLSENIANFKFIGEYKTKSENSDGPIEIDSVLPTEKIAEKEGINFGSEREYFSVKIPVEMNTERIITKYSNIFFERNGKTIEVNLTEPYHVIDYGKGTRENIVFIE